MMLAGILEVVRPLDRDAQSAYRIVGSAGEANGQKKGEEGLLFSIRSKEGSEGGSSACRTAPSMTGA